MNNDPAEELRLLRRDYAVLRYSLEDIARKVGAENYLNEEGVDPVDVLQIARDALGITSASKAPFYTDASIRRYIQDRKTME